MNMVSIRNYVKGVLKTWYEKNYEFLRTNDPTWLSSPLLQLVNPKHPTSIFSPSANRAWHEAEAYQVLRDKGYTVAFTVGDLFGKDFYQTCTDKDDFRYIHENQALEDVDEQETYDIILDCKGALWYALYKKTCGNSSILAVLSKYEHLLKDETSILMIDGYAYVSFSWFMNYVIAYLPIKLKKFRENSTLYYLKQRFPNLDLSVHEIATQDPIENTNKMHMVYLTKTDITRLKEAILCSEASCDLLTEQSFPL